MTAPRVLVSIANWNGGEAIIACLETLYKSEFRSFAVVVIDNTSSDASADSIQRKFPWVTVVRSEENVGLCAEQNLGLRLAKKQGFDYVWVLNGDTLIDGGANGDINAALAMIGMRAPQRRKAIGFVDARPWLSRRVTWYVYKASTTFATDSRRRERTR